VKAPRGAFTLPSVAVLSSGRGTLKMGGEVAMGNKSHAELFNCPNCNAQYKLVRAEADHAASYSQIECYHCGAPLNGREAQFILKYFLVDRPRRQLKPSGVK
jgi:hypothetical protein